VKHHEQCNANSNSAIKASAEVIGTALHPVLIDKAGVLVLATPMGEAGRICSSNTEDTRICLNSQCFAYKRIQNCSSNSTGASKEH
jgi:hypothetical protein